MDYLLREGHYNTALLLAKDSNISVRAYPHSSHGVGTCRCGYFYVSEACDRFSL